MTPLAIQIMLACYVSPEPWGNMQPKIWNSPAAQEVRNALATVGLIDRETLRATERGERYVKTLCEVEP